MNVIFYFREVDIYKLIGRGSIDETMLKIQNHKLQLGEDLSEELQGNKLKFIEKTLILFFLRIKNKS